MLMVVVNDAVWMKKKQPMLLRPIPRLCFVLFLRHILSKFDIICGKHDAKLTVIVIGIVTRLMIAVLNSMMFRVMSRD